MPGQMEYPEDMMGWNGVLVTGSVVITLLYAALGFFGFLAYGLKIKATVTLNLPEEPLYQVASNNNNSKKSQIINSTF